MLSSILNEYPFAANSHNELLQSPGTPRPHWQPLIDALSGEEAAEMRKRVENVRRLVHENGLTYNAYADTQGGQRPWDLDPLPFILPQDEWVHIEAAVIQRATILNTVLRDIYGEQTLMAQGMLPPALIHGNAGFLRPCHGIPQPDGIALHMYAVDLARSADGRWWVVSDRTQAPAGTGYALENRMVISSVFPDLFRDLNIQRLSGFFASLRDSLAHWGRECAYRQSQANPNIAPLSPSEQPLTVILTAGPFNETYHEQSYLAGYLGFPLVQGNDLTVREGVVWLKTLAGLKPVHAILRRLDDIYCDPLELNAESLLGIAGLTEVARRGHVLLANSLGSNVLQSGALMGFLPALSQHLLKQPLMLPSVATWWCGEPQALETVIANLDRLLIKNAFLHTREIMIYGQDLDGAAREELIAQLRANPENYLAQELVKVSQAPVWNSQLQQMQAQSVGLRVFACATPNGYIVMPGGLTRVASSTNKRVITMQGSGCSKDTWVITPEFKPNTPSLLRKTTSSAGLVHDNIHLSSRVIENLFWFGRHSVRSYHATRLLRTAIHYLLDFSPEHRAVEWPTVKAMCIWYNLMPADEDDASESNYPLFAEDENAIECLLIAAIFADDSSSLASHITQFFQLAFSLRERLSGDHWRLINQLHLRFAERPSSASLSEALAVLDETNMSLVTISGFTLDSMTRDQGWRFLSLGRRIERLQFLCILLQKALAMPAESSLDWLLELTDSIVTYRARYAAQPEWLPVLYLLLIDENNPNAMMFQLRGLVKYLSQISSTYNGGGGEGRMMERMESLRTFDVDASFHHNSPELMAWLSDTYQASVEISTQLGHRFFSFSDTTAN